MFTFFLLLSIFRLPRQKSECLHNFILICCVNVFYFIDGHEILRVRSERKPIFLLKLISQHDITIKNITECPIIKYKFPF